MNSKIKLVISISILLLLLSLYGFFQLKKQASYKIDGNVIGNTAGNLRGEGLFCEYNGKVYFSNAYDQGCLYVMDPDGSHMKKLTKSSASYINIGGDHIFYYMQSAKGGTGLGYIRAISGLYRCDLKGRDTTCLNGDLLTMAVLCGDKLIFQHYDQKNFSTVNKLATDNSKQMDLLYDGIIETACISDGQLYYSGTDKDHYLYALNPANGSSQIIWRGNLCYPTIVNQYVYYLDIDRNYQLCRYDRSADQIQVLTTDRVDFYNIYGDVVFYQKNDRKEPGLIRMNVDGSNPELIASGIYNRINTTSTYTYFYSYDTDEKVYRVNTFGGTYVDNFQEAFDAAYANSK